jgi:hypothetical protein
VGTLGVPWRSQADEHGWPVRVKTSSVGVEGTLGVPWRSQADGAMDGRQSATDETEQYARLA